MRATFLDYLLILLGVALSVYLVRIGPLHVEAREAGADLRLRTVVTYLPEFMRLTEGVILIGPLLLAIQWLRGRKQGLTSIEWLCVLSWFGAAILAGLEGWRNAFPDWAPPWSGRLPWLWYLIVVPSMAGLGLVMRLLGLFSRRPAPWTHALGLALLVWPVLPLAAVLAVGKF
ncbi:MAG TPA: hypothetical protein VMS17_12160 [Gemmataceae bacterium]|nr:hypothetical protein [Gemmataceae bacterium]